jgi:PAS domain S-box-containing protein
MPDQDRGIDAAAARYRSLTEHIQDAVVEFELEQGRPVVRTVNDAFVEVFEYDRDVIEGEHLNDWIVPEWQMEEARELDERTGSGEINYRRVKRETASGLREFLYRGIPFDEDAIATDGIAVYTDLTDIARHERRLQVMNRILRHNLRNKVNVISAHTSRLLDELDAEDAAEYTGVAATVEDAAHELETLTEEAKHIQAIVDSEVGDVAVDCVPIVQQIARGYRKSWPAADIRTDLPPSLTVDADSRLRYAIESLVDNALEHNPAESPTVRIRGAEADADGWVCIRVDDDGPGIPTHERRVITGDAEITSTQHGSGLGLWLVKWTTELFGGEVSFAESDLGGNSVRLRLPGG